MNMKIDEVKSDGILLIGIEGRLDTTSYSLLENRLIELIDSGQVRIIIDCSKMDYISSSGLRVFLLALKKIILEKGKFILINLQETIREIFEIAGFTTIFEIYGSMEEAKRAMEA